MGLCQDVEQQLKTLSASSAMMPAQILAQSPDGTQLKIEVTAVDSMSCAFSELSLFVPRLQQASLQILKQWADNLSQQVTYLLEAIGPLEIDTHAGQILLRSTTPHQSANGTSYYEMVVSTPGQGTLVLRRYASQSGQAGRTPVEIRVTHDVLYRLTDDLIATCPPSP